MTMFATITAAPAAATIASAAIAENNAAQDAEIIAAWERSQAAMRELYAEDWGHLSVGEEDKRYDALHDALSADETIIQNARAATLKGVEIQLWVAFRHAGTSREDETDLANDRFDQIFAAVDDLDFDADMIVRAIMALRRMGA